jgi:UDP-N-acetylglucosamine/UDP-N-acetylgalactosamine diphosphorylase
MKLEKFVFDVFPFAEKFGVLEGERSHEFSPLKNGPDAGKCCPATCRSDVLQLHHSYLVNAGVNFNGDDVAACEISPLVSYAGEGLERYAQSTLPPSQMKHLER